MRHQLPKLYSYPEKEKMLTFPGMSLREFMASTTVYEKMPAPFAPSLRRATRIGMLLTLITFLVILLLPSFVERIPGMYFPFMFAWVNLFLEGYLHWLAQDVWIRYIDGVLLGAAGILLLVTRNLRWGRIEEQWLAFIQVMGGCVNLIVLIIPLAMLISHAVLWLLLGLLMFLVVVGVLRLLVALAGTNR